MATIDEADFVIDHVRSRLKDCRRALDTYVRGYEEFISVLSGTMISGWTGLADRMLAGAGADLKRLLLSVPKHEAVRDKILIEFNLQGRGGR